ncbi:murein hydrolase activator EnvC family protein [Ferrimonas balearica]|uniref:murein hydrolase activator EnvC family protein n=1 Tax=Ferrimonas balearica TaxID=44012 RepID=UPI002D806CF8|nr:peptidoglycan DD-metalloendopeptidase family protein [Ferrimonas balearica]MBY6019505.1 peptidoglycan DD-metalloendopeptidase family protein [Halomonas denitrificans]MBY6096570.1 peptidoglycan DD-metalloendopeptidase family protein [Ferrimonas balearica]
MKRLLSLTLLLLLATPVAGQEDVAQQQAQLDKLSREIQQRQAKLSKAQVAKDGLQAELRRTDKAISDSAQALKGQQRALAKSEATLAELGQRQSELEASQRRQRDQLAAQVRTAWMSGGQDHTALLLGNDDPATLERMLVYYQYLNQARIDAIEALKATAAELASVISQQQQERDRQADLLRQQERERSRLAERQKERQTALAKLERQLQRDSNQLALMQEDREVLERAITEALEALARSATLDGLADSKGRLPWPTSGKVSKGFGSHREGQLKWNGWLMSAPAGREIKAISAGQVVFADWLRGFGLVVVVDHGEQYLSLYGHTQALLKQVGEDVKPGEVIALTGSSGGLRQPGLYFEIRHRGRAVDPKPYLKKG